MPAKPPLSPTTERNGKPRSIPPCAEYLYFDMIQVWVKHVLADEDLHRLKEECGSGGLHVATGHGPVPGLRQRLQLRQPTKAALAILAARPHHLNKLECTYDRVHLCEEDCDEDREFVERFHVKRFHRSEVRVFKSTRYTDARRARNNFVIYSDKPCRLTGEVHCLHLEWRVTGPEALAQIGIRGVADLLKMDLVSFWKSRLRFFRFDPERLGRATLNKTRRKRVPQFIRSGNFVYNVHRRAGDSFLRHVGAVRLKDGPHSSTSNSMIGSSQDVLDKYGRTFGRGRLVRCLIPEVFHAFNELDQEVTGLGHNHSFEGNG